MDLYSWIPQPQSGRLWRKAEIHQWPHARLCLQEDWLAACDSWKYLHTAARLLFRLPLWNLFGRITYSMSQQCAATLQSCWHLRGKEQSKTESLQRLWIYSMHNLIFQYQGDEYSMGKNHVDYSPSKSVTHSSVIFENTSLFSDYFLRLSKKIFILLTVPK